MTQAYKKGGAWFNITSTLSEEEYEKLERVAKELGTTRNKVMRMALVDFSGMKEKLDALDPHLLQRDAEIKRVTQLALDCAEGNICIAATLLSTSRSTVIGRISRFSLVVNRTGWGRGPKAYAKAARRFENGNLRLLGRQQGDSSGSRQE